MAEGQRANGGASANATNAKRTYVRPAVRDVLSDRTKRETSYRGGWQYYGGDWQAGSRLYTDKALDAIDNRTRRLRMQVNRNTQYGSAERERQMKRIDNASNKMRNIINSVHLRTNLY